MESRYLRPYRSEEFQEEDVWGVIKEASETGVKDNPRTRRSISRRLPSAARMIPGGQAHQHNSNDSSESKLMQNSAPVNVPDWSKIYGKTPKKNNINDSSSSPFDHIRGDSEEDNEDDDCGNGGGDDDEEDRLPPHEWLAKKLARSQISSFSVCEGVGRTLKGRDLSRVRNAVLSKTGFL